MNAFDVNQVDFSKGLVPVVTQDSLTGEVLMVAFTDAEALRRTVETGLMHYHSRRRGLWKKGETSGHTQTVVSLQLDCDQDCILARVKAAGPACHNGTPSCFLSPQGDVVSELVATIEARAKQPSAESYTAKLLANRNLRLKKLGEEAAELVLALADGDKANIAEEAADLTYHLLVAIQAAGVSFDAVRQVLARRASK
jgi:phosphoribosyl-AMP cyclohydrolase / phosphoribosyl-ATP pyrophosphohydrolase